jgi:hypothetical protein
MLQYAALDAAATRAIYVTLLQLSESGFHRVPDCSLRPSDSDLNVLLAQPRAAEHHSMLSAPITASAGTDAVHSNQTGSHQSVCTLADGVCAKNALSSDIPAQSMDQGDNAFLPAKGAMLAAHL